MQNKTRKKKKMPRRKETILMKTVYKGKTDLQKKK